MGIEKTALKIFRFLTSLKLAIAVLLALTLSLITATLLESSFDTPTAQYWVYRASWFYALLALLGVNILCVALSRYPWRLRHLPFLLAHAGILILLTGSWLTDRYGLDGHLRLTEGETSASAEVSVPTLFLMEGDEIHSVKIRWTPPHAKYQPLSLDSYGLVVDRFIAHAEPTTVFERVNPGTKNDGAGPPALHLRIVGGPMRISQDFWLWAGDLEWSSIQAGPARLTLQEGTIKGTPVKRASGPELRLRSLPGGDLVYEAYTREGTKRTGRLGADKIQGQVIQTGWRGGVTVTFEEWIPHATRHTTYHASKAQYGDEAPPSAIHLASASPAVDLWLGLGDRSSVQVRGREVLVGYSYERRTLPFALHLEHFTVDHYEGTRDPSGYSSLVRVIEGSSPGSPILISMNEPLDHRGITFYQASFEDAEPRPVTTVLSVNRDPGRWMKYLGSLLIVFGSILLFSVKYVKKRKGVK